MNRRHFLKALSILPAMGLISPSLVMAVTSDTTLSLETIINIIQTDKRLNRRVSATNIADAVMCAIDIHLLNFRALRLRSGC